jgi:hypothetical protein
MDDKVAHGHYDGYCKQSESSFFHLFLCNLFLFSSFVLPALASIIYPKLKSSHSGSHLPYQAPLFLIYIPSPAFAQTFFANAFPCFGPYLICVYLVACLFEFPSYPMEIV